MNHEIQTRTAIRLWMGSRKASRLIGLREQGAIAIGGAIVPRIGRQLKAGDHLIIKRADGIREIVPVSRVEREAVSDG